MLRLVRTAWKCWDFFLQMSGILHTRILTYCNSDTLIDISILLKPCKKLTGTGGQDRVLSKADALTKNWMFLYILSGIY